jgi:hypothetical protein
MEGQQEGNNNLEYSGQWQGNHYALKECISMKKALIEWS